MEQSTSTAVMEPTEQPAQPAHPMSLKEASRLRILDPARARFTQSGCTLRFELEDERCVPRAVLARVYPLSEPERWLSVREEDGEEIGVLLELSGLDPASLEVARQSLERRYFLPAIRQILRTKELFGVVNWEVETDRGPCKFTTRNLREGLVRPSPDRMIITDVDGNRFDIRSFDELDRHSQALVLSQI